MNVATTLTALLLLAVTQGSRLVYHNDGASQPDELDLMELYIGEPPSPSALMNKRGGQSPKGTTGLWFGPRLGRRRRSVDEAGREKRQIDNSLMGKEELVKLGQDGPWALLALRGGKRRGVNTFTPRLGRESEEEVMENYMEPYSSYIRNPTRSDGGQAPGNVGSNFTPRLGRLAPLEPH